MAHHLFCAEPLPEPMTTYRGYPAKMALSVVGPFWQDTLDIAD